MPRRPETFRDTAATRDASVKTKTTAMSNLLRGDMKAILLVVVGGVALDDGVSWSG